MSLLNNEDIIIVKKIPGTYIKGQYIEGSYNYVRGKASVQPINDNELQCLPEGNRIKGTLKFYSEFEISNDNFLRRTNENVAKVMSILIDNVLDSTDYTCTINGTIFLYNSGIGATKFSIVNGIVNTILLGSELVIVKDNLDGSYTVTSEIEGTDFTLSVDFNQMAMLDYENIQKQYKCMQDKDYTSHSLKHYKAYGFLQEQVNGL
jgi:hypothetical protein